MIRLFFILFSFIAVSAQAETKGLDVYTPQNIEFEPTMVYAKDEAALCGVTFYANYTFKNNKKLLVRVALGDSLIVKDNLLFSSLVIRGFIDDREFDIEKASMVLDNSFTFNATQKPYVKDSYGVMGFLKLRNLEKSFFPDYLASELNIISVWRIDGPHYQLHISRVSAAVLNRVSKCHDNLKKSVKKYLK